MRKLKHGEVICLLKAGEKSKWDVHPAADVQPLQFCFSEYGSSTVIGLMPRMTVLFCLLFRHLEMMFMFLACIEARFIKGIEK